MSQQRYRHGYPMSRGDQNPNDRRLSRGRCHIGVGPQSGDGDRPQGDVSVTSHEPFDSFTHCNGYMAYQLPSGLTYFQSNPNDVYSNGISSGASGPLAHFAQFGHYRENVSNSTPEGHQNVNQQGRNHPAFNAPSSSSMSDNYRSFQSPPAAATTFEPTPNSQEFSVGPRQRYEDRNRNSRGSFQGSNSNRGRYPSRRHEFQHRSNFHPTNGRSERRRNEPVHPRDNSFGNFGTLLNQGEGIEPHQFNGAVLPPIRGNSNYGQQTSKTVSGKSPSKAQSLKVKSKPEFESSTTEAQTSKPKPGKSMNENRRDTLIDQLTRNTLECMICCEKIRRTQHVWSCDKCFNIFHLPCIEKWARSSVDKVGWRCPGCQSYSDTIPRTYFCFCKRTRHPATVGPHDVPHSCGSPCEKRRQSILSCSHPCPLLCHPGPCPPCEVQCIRKCCCGATKASVICSSKTEITCNNICNKLLYCEFHRCERPCHTGMCDGCRVPLDIGCYCGKERQTEFCTKNNRQNPEYSCEEACNRLLQCKQHRCPDICHVGVCNPCKTSPDYVLSCPCGQTEIEEALALNHMPPRTSCLDLIPVCNKTCNKILPCGPIGDSHKCAKQCHLDPKCPPCSGVTPTKCRCGNRQFEIPCQEFDPSEVAICERKCTKKRSCGRHKCNNKCCIDEDHICEIICGKRLSCGNHRCDDFCHNGHCDPCNHLSFEELSCICGSTVIFPPVPCGTVPPVCEHPCTRSHNCEHPIVHTCHSERDCPPCTFLTSKWCYGQHEMRNNILCHITQVSCGMPCKKKLKCERHSCVRTCHPNECLSSDEICKLPCTTLRKNCLHICAAPCHEGECPELRCKEITDVTCPCGRKKDTLVCWKREIEFEKIVGVSVSVEMIRLKNENESTVIDEEAIIQGVKSQQPKQQVLPCDKECAKAERNRKLAEALQLNTECDTTWGTPNPNYSESLIKFAQKQPRFVEIVHKNLMELVQKAKKSKRKNETYSFDSMSRDKRQVIHEYSNHFGCLSQSFDEEPERHVMVTASKELSYVPPVTLIEAAFRPRAKTERKDGFEELQLCEQMKSQILGPANPRSLTVSRTSEMVPLKQPDHGNQ